MNRITILNRIHKDLKIPLGKLIHSSKYVKVMNELNNFIKEWWDEFLCYYVYKDVVVNVPIFNWRGNDLIYDGNNAIYNWNLKKMTYKAIQDSNYEFVFLPQRYEFTTIKEHIKDVKLIKVSNNEVITQ